VPQGTVVRYGPTRVSVNSASALQKIYGSQANTKKSQWYSVWVEVFKYDTTMTTIDKKKHEVKRGILTHALNSAAVKQMEEKVLKNIRRLCELLIDQDDKSKWSNPKDMTTLVGFCTSDIMGDTTFSRNWNMLDSKNNRDIFYIIPRGISGLTLASLKVLQTTIVVLTLNRLDICHSSLNCVFSNYSVVVY
jgi:hypothetical protein